MRSYQQQLEKEIADDRNAHGKDDLKPPKNPPTDTTTITQSTTDPESGLFHKGEHKEVFAYTIQTAPQVTHTDGSSPVKAFPQPPRQQHLLRLPPQTPSFKTGKLVMDAGYKPRPSPKPSLKKTSCPSSPTPGPNQTGPRRPLLQARLRLRRLLRLLPLPGRKHPLLQHHDT